MRSQLDRVRAAVEFHPGLTSAEYGRSWYADSWNLNRYVFARRLPELERKGLIHRGEQQHCRITGRQALTWWPVLKGE